MSGDMSACLFLINNLLYTERGLDQIEVVYLEEIKRVIHDNNQSGMLKKEVVDRINNIYDRIF